MPYLVDFVCGLLVWVGVDKGANSWSYRFIFAKHLDPELGNTFYLSGISDKGVALGARSKLARTKGLPGTVVVSFVATAPRFEDRGLYLFDVRFRNEKNEFEHVKTVMVLKLSGKQWESYFPLS